jgi:hypothetical protein
MSDAAATSDTGTAAPATTAATPPASPWGELPDNLKAVVANKGWKSPADAAKSYDELHRFVGAEKAGRGLVLPDPSKATPEELAAFRAKAASVDGGIPESPEGYGFKLPDDFPDPEFGKTASTLFHKHHVPKAIAEGLMQDFAAQVQAGEVARVQAEQKEFEKQEADLKSEWGVEFEKNCEIAKRGMKRLGFTDEIIDALEAKAGFAGVIKAMHQAGIAVGEGKFIDGGSDGGNFAESHDTLIAKRLALYSDKAWAARFNANEPTARNEARALEEKIAAARKQMAR